MAVGLAIPATSHAADPFGTAQFVQEVNSAVREATAMAPHASMAVAVPPADTSKTLEAATKSLELATKQAAAAASNAAAEAQRATQSAALESRPGAVRRAARPAAKAHRRHAARRASPAGRSSLRGPLARELLAGSEGAAARLVSPSRADLPAGRAQNGTARAAGASPKETRGPTPQRPPRLPLPPQPGPGATLSGQGGGHGPLMPLLLGVLAGALLMMAFEFLPRALPPKAFRKPRLIALLPWHPG
jgi:hypothetical protein